jgi:hypothetical protein
MRKRSLVGPRHHLILVTDRLFPMPLRSAQPVLLIVPGTPIAQRLMGALLVSSTESSAQ